MQKPSETNIDELINQEPSKGLSWKAILWIVLGFLVACVAFQLYFRYLTRESALLEKQAEATRNASSGLQGAITVFHYHYKTWPVGGSGSDWDGASDDALLMAELLPTIAKKLNTRGIPLLAVGPPKISAPGVLGGGLETNPATGEARLLDPWGNPYKIRIDTNGDGKLADPELGASVTVHHQSVIIWSAGPDGDFTTWPDNVKSW
jgi:hypothetical protein